MKVVRHFMLNEVANSRHDFDREIVGISCRREERRELT
jgi:hypothetical protein